jgi:hypothetical protein
VGALLLRYRFRVKNGKLTTLKICTSNIIFYGLFLLMMYLAEKDKSILWHVSQIVFLAELLVCFIPKIKTRFSLYIFGIEMHVIPKKKLPNDGILL